MTRRRLLCGLLLSAVLVCFAGWLWVASAHAPNTTRARFGQVRKGMLREDVIRVVGRPPAGNLETQIGDRIFDEWACEDGVLLVHFDDSGAADEMLIISSEPTTFTERIRRWP